MENKKLPIFEIKYDVDNPRIKYLNPHVNDGTDEDAFQNELIPNLLKSPSVSGNATTFQNLKASIKATKGILTPIWVKKEGGVYKCIEGNTRLCVYRELYNETENADDKQRWSEIPSIVYEDIPKEVEHSLKLSAHVVGARPWTPYSRAKYVNELLDQTFTWEKIVEIVGGQKSSLQKEAVAQKNFDKFYADRHSEYSERRFSFFKDAENFDLLNYLSDEHQISGETYGDWVHENKMKQAYNLRHMKKIFSNEEAKNAFLDGDINDALPFITSKKDKNLKDFSETALVKELQSRLEDHLAMGTDFGDMNDFIQEVIILEESIREILRNLSESDLESL